MVPPPNTNHHLHSPPHTTPLKTTFHKDINEAIIKVYNDAIMEAYDDAYIKAYNNACIEAYNDA